MQPMTVPSGAEVKRGAYLDHIRSGACTRQEGLVLAVLALAAEPLTRHEIAERGGMALSAACGRVSALVDRQLLEVAGTVKPAGCRSPRSTLRLTDQGRTQAAEVLAQAEEGAACH